MQSINFRGYALDEWSIDKEYDANTLVKDNSGNMYISTRKVHKGENLGNSDVWLPVVDTSALSAEVDEISEDVETMKETLYGEDNDGLVSDVGTIQDTLYGEDNDGLVDDVDAIIDNLTIEGETPVVFKFAVSDGVYGFMVGDVFHPFGAEVVPSNGEE